MIDFNDQLIPDDDQTVTQLRYEIDSRLRQSFVDQHSDNRAILTLALSVVSGRFDDVVKDVRRGTVTPTVAKTLLDDAVRYNILTRAYADLIMLRIPTVPLPPNCNEHLALEHIVACFHFLLANYAKPAQKYTCAELAEAIKDHYSLDNPKVAWTVAFLEERADSFLTIRNY
jgi:hypothetical protein